MSYSTTRNNSATIRENNIITMNIITSIIMKPVQNTKINNTIKKRIIHITYFPHGGKVRTNTKTMYHIQMCPFLLPSLAVLLITASMLK
jgi:hypothetical protein